jgi:hypothetical protein
MLQERWRLFFTGIILKNDISFPEPTTTRRYANFTGGRQRMFLPMGQRY